MKSCVGWSRNRTNGLAVPVGGLRGGSRDGDRAGGVQDAVQAHRAQRGTGEPASAAVSDDKQVVSPRLLDQRGGRRPGHGAHPDVHPRRGGAPFPDDVGDELLGLSLDRVDDLLAGGTATPDDAIPIPTGQFSGVTATLTTSSTASRRAASCRANSSAVRVPADPSTPTTTLAR